MAQLLRSAVVASLVLLLAAAASAATEPPAWCQAALQRAAGMYAHCLTRSAALAIQVDGHASEQWCRASLARAFALVQQWGLPCPEDPSPAVVRTTLAQCVATAIEHVRDDISGEATSACDARKIRAAGRYLRCRQRQAARASEGLDDDADIASRCEGRLERSWERAAATSPCATEVSSDALQSHLDDCLAPLSPALAALEGEVTILATFPDGQPRQLGIAIAPTVDSFWVVAGRENVYFAESSLARDLLDHVGDTVRVRGEMRVGLEFLRTVFIESFEAGSEARVAPLITAGEEETVEGTITVVDRYANGHPRRLAVVDAERRATQLAVTNKSQELLFRIGRRMRVVGTRSGMRDLGVHAYTELDGSPLVAAGDGFRMSFLAGGRDENGVLMGGVEVDTLAAFDGKIFAGTSYRKNTQFESADPEPPGAQVLVLDRANGGWRADLTVPAEEAGAAPRMVYLTTVRFDTDGGGRPLDPPIERLAAVSGNGEIYLRAPGAIGEWTGTGLPDVVQAVAGPDQRPDARSVVGHTDRVTGRSILLAGAGVGRRGAGGGIYRGSWDPALPGRIAWSPAPELEIPDARPNPRVMGLIEAEGRVYASVGRQLLERVDGEQPTWREIYRDELDAGADSLRRATPVRGPNGSTSLLVGIEGFDGRLVRVDLDAGTATDEIFGRGAVDGVFHALLGYNGPAVRELDDGTELAIMGLHVLRPRRGPVSTEIPDLGRHYDYAEGLILLRTETGELAVQRILDRTLEVHPPLIGTRAILPHSPFPGEEDVVYFAGFDHDGHLFHNTGWIYKAHLADVRDVLYRVP